MTTVLEFSTLREVRVNCFAVLQHPRHPANDNRTCIFDVLIPICYNPALSPVPCTMRYAPDRRETFRPGTYQIVATVPLYHLSSPS